jgi:phenylalanyl-tRNA synthetase beta chain
MSKESKVEIFVCSACGNEFTKWSGTCLKCGEWNTLKSFEKKTSVKSKIRNGSLESISLVNISNQNKAEDRQKVGLQGSVKIENPITEDMHIMTPALLPVLIHAALNQQNHHFGSEKLSIRNFEIRPTFHAPEGVNARSETETGVQEHWRVCWVMSGARMSNGLDRDLGELDFYDHKAVFERLMNDLGVGRGLRLMSPADAAKIPQKGAVTPGAMALRELKSLFHPGQTVEILAGPQTAGFFGMLHPRLQKKLKLRDPLWIAELDWSAIVKMARGAFESRPFQNWSSFPSMERDFALLVKNEISAEKLLASGLKAGAPIAKTARIFDVYRGAQVAEGMTSVAIRVIFNEEGRSLQEAETEAAAARMIEAWKKEFQAELR